jgi:tetratricopeptide (TPR) repeat protein
MIFESYIKKAINEITNENFSEAKDCIHLAILEDDASPKTHNLLGIIEEITGDLSLAEKHYRAAYALDPTFKPACINLERITKFYYRLNIKNIDFVEKLELKEEPPYVIEYDCNNVGHLIKRINFKANC